MDLSRASHSPVAPPAQARESADSAVAEAQERARGEVAAAEERADSAERGARALRDQLREAREERDASLRAKKGEMQRSVAHFERVLGEYKTEAQRLEARNQELEARVAALLRERQDVQEVQGAASEVQGCVAFLPPGLALPQGRASLSSPTHTHRSLPSPGLQAAPGGDARRRVARLAGVRAGCRAGGAGGAAGQ